MRTEETKKINLKKYNKLENVCCEHPLEGETILENVEDIFDILDCHYDLTVEENFEDALEKVSNIKVFERKKYQIREGWLQEILQDDATDNFYMDYHDAEIEGIDIIKKFVEDYNSVQTWYIADGNVAILDLSKEFKEYVFCNARRELYQLKSQIVDFETSMEITKLEKFLQSEEG